MKLIKWIIIDSLYFEGSFTFNVKLKKEIPGLRDILTKWNGVFL